MRLNHYNYEGKLIRVPFPGNILLNVPSIMTLKSDSDFEVASTTGSSFTQPIIISFYEHFELISIIIKDIWGKIPEIDTIFVNFSFPTWAKLTPILLNENIFFCFGIEKKKEDFISKEIPILTIEDSFVRLPVEYGDNSININLYTKNDYGIVFDEFTRSLEQFGIEKK